MKKNFCRFLLFPLGISLFSCSGETSAKGTNHGFTLEADPHFTYRVDLKCKNGDSSSLSPDYTFSSVSDAQEANIVLEEVIDGYRHKDNKVNVLVTSDKGNSVTYELENKIHPDNSSSLLVYYGTLTDLPEGSLNFKILSNLEENEVELKSNYNFELVENDGNYVIAANFVGANNLDQMDFERLGYNAEAELGYLADHLYVKYNYDLGFGTEEMTFEQFAGYYLQHVNDLEFYKYKTSDNVYFEVYAKNEYVSFVCDGSFQPVNVQFKNKDKHIDKSMISMIQESIINSNGKLGFRYKLNSPDSIKITMDFDNWLIPHDLIGIEFAEFEGMSQRDNKWFQIESVNGDTSNTRKYTSSNNSILAGYAKTTDFTIANNNQIDIVFGLTSEGLAHKDELSNYVYNVYSGGTATFNPTTNKLTVKAKAPYLSNDPQYFSRIYLDTRYGINS